MSRPVPLVLALSALLLVLTFVGLAAARRRRRTRPMLVSDAPAGSQRAVLRTVDDLLEDIAREQRARSLLAASFVEDAEPEESERESELVLHA